jgi:hypothetical protein
MNAATITALSGAIVAILGALGAFLHSIQTRRQVTGQQNTQDKTSGQ